MGGENEMQRYAHEPHGMIQEVNSNGNLLHSTYLKEQLVIFKEEDVAVLCYVGLGSRLRMMHTLCRLLSLTCRTRANR